MGEAFHRGGWGMYPTAIAGFILVAFAIRYAVSPDARRSLVVRRLSTLTFLVGTLGTLAGVIKTFTSEPPPRGDYSMYLQGIGESLNCLGMALGPMVIAAIAMSIGAARIASDSPELTDPHA